MKRDIDEKLEQLANERAVLRLFEIIVVKTETGYELFNRYTVTGNEQGWKLQCMTTNLTHDFYLLKSAATFCVFHHANQIALAERVLFLDGRLSGAVANLHILRRLSARKNSAAASAIYAAKISEHEQVAAQVAPQLAVLCDQSRLHQLNKFHAKKINKL